MNSLELSIKHLAWSNQRFFSYFCDKSDETFALQAAVGEWPIGQILTHLAGSGEWFRYCLTGEKWSDLKAITTAEIALEYLPIMANLDATLSREFSKPDESLEIQGEREIILATRSLILSQAVMHAAEHKGQIATILKLHKQHLDLDALDVWTFVSSNKTN